MARSKANAVRINLPEVETEVIGIGDLTLVDAKSDYADTLYVASRHQTGGDGWAEFVASIKNGIINPLIVFETEDGEFLIGAGRRRYLAAKEAKLKEVPVKVYPYDENLAVQVMVEENSQRLDDDFSTKVEIVSRMRNNLKMGYEQIGNLFGVSHQAVRDWEAVSNLPKKIVDAVQAGTISTYAAKELTKLDNEIEQVEAFDRMTSKVSVDGKSGKVSMREAKEAVTGKPVSSKPTPAQLKALAADSNTPSHFRLFINAVLGELTIKQIRDLDTEGELEWLEKWPKVESKANNTKAGKGKAAKRVAGKAAAPKRRAVKTAAEVDSSMFE